VNAASLRAAALALPLTVALACGACDRRRSDPPERSATSDTTRAA